MEKLLGQALGQDVSNLAAEEKRLLLSRLLGRFAHEIRNPLSSLDIHVQLLEEDLAQAGPHVREKTAGRLEIIHGELHRLETIVRHFISLSGPSSLNLRAADVSRMVRHVCDLLHPEAARRSIEITTKVPENLPAVVLDCEQITQALMNLVINAVQAVESNGRVEVTAAANKGGEILSFEVCDTGPGIPAEKQSAIFEPFYTTKPEGSGLGLWIVEQIVTAHGGVVGVSNGLNGGAVFVVQLPLRDQESGHG